jgi:hydrogenase expression/formation protein HypE
VDERADFDGWSCPVPRRDDDRILLGHGGGGRLSAELIERVFLPAFGIDANDDLHDAATVITNGERLAFSTDSYVVRPLFFAGGCIGDLAVNGTVNDVSMAGARPIALSVGFIIEEGFEMAVLSTIVDAMADAARTAGVRIVTGDTKVVERGHADGLYINTAGIGVIADGVDIRPSRAEPGDIVIVSGPIGRHGMAVLSKREGLEFATDIVTDSAPLHGLVEAMIGVTPDIHMMRDPTRGGLTASLCEIAAAGRVGIEYVETSVPVPTDVAAACSMLGLDPMHVANEGCLVAIIAAHDADAVLAAMHQHPQGSGARVIGRVTDAHPGVVTAVTPLGTVRVVELPLGEQLPRIC